MPHRSALPAFFLMTLAPVLVNAQSMTDRDPTHHPVPMYSKSEKKRAARFRAVEGIVKNEQDNPVQGALVNLKNLKTNSTVTYITKADGKYYFDELSREEDYELSASFSGKNTPVKKLSHYDTQTNVMRILTFADPDDQSVQRVHTKGGR